LATGLSFNLLPLPTRYLANESRLASGPNESSVDQFDTITPLPRRAPSRRRSGIRRSLRMQVGLNRFPQAAMLMMDVVLFFY
jgi:hypothetical protein